MALEEKRMAYQLTSLALGSIDDPNSKEGQKLARKHAAARAAYLEALGKVADFDEARTVEAVLPSFEADDGEIRGSALETLRWLSHTGSSPDAIEAARDSLSTAEDGDEERAALEILVRYGDEGEVLSLLEPLALKAGPNQDFAAQSWLRIREEQAAREKATEASDQ